METRAIRPERAPSTISGSEPGGRSRENGGFVDLTGRMPGHPEFLAGAPGFEPGYDEIKSAALRRHTTIGARPRRARCEPLRRPCGPQEGEAGGAAAAHPRQQSAGKRREAAERGRDLGTWPIAASVSSLRRGEEFGPARRRRPASRRTGRHPAVERTSGARHTQFPDQANYFPDRPINSLLSRNRYPVPMRRELGPKPLIYMPYSGQ